MTMPYCILHTEADSDVVLNGLGFSENDIHAALTSALYERRKSSKLHPAVDAGFRFWSEMVAATRRILIGKGNGWSLKWSSEWKWSLTQREGLI